MEVDFHAVDEPEPGEKLAEAFRRRWPAYREWFLREGEKARARYLTCVRALRAHMPELVPTYERLVDLAGGGDVAARFLSLYRPPPYLSACSQAAWTRETPFLVRNYDYAPRLWEATLLRSAWTGAAVVAMTDCLWGALDGVNEAGLAVSLSFGGSRRVGDGFGMPLIVRYVLERCETTAEGAWAIARIPSHMAYNVTLLDAAGHGATVLVAPGRTAEVTDRRVATNHQAGVDPDDAIRGTASVERERLLARLIGDESETGAAFVRRFLEPPLFADGLSRGWTTLYTAIFTPSAGDARYVLRGHEVRQRLDAFAETSLHLDYGSESDG